MRLLLFALLGRSFTHHLLQLGQPCLQRCYLLLVLLFLLLKLPLVFFQRLSGRE